LIAGFCQIWPSNGTAALFCGVHFWTNFGRLGGGGVVRDSQTRKAGQIWLIHPVKKFKRTTINCWMAGLGRNW
jgi:hypothetical protein